MNLILLEATDFPEGLPTSQVTLTGRRATHIREVHRASPGRTLRLGLEGGSMGTGEVLEITGDKVVIGNILLDQTPPPKIGLTLLLAMPRPKVLTRVIEAATSLGVERIYLMNGARVEKSYFDSPRMDAGAIRDALVRGVEQSRDTILPDIVPVPLFRPFVEDQSTSLFKDHLKLVAHPGGYPNLLRAVTDLAHASEEANSAGKPLFRRAVIAIGPEGGFVPFEIDLLERQGFRPFQIGERILRVETAVPLVIGQYLAMRSWLTD